MTAGRPLAKLEEPPPNKEEDTRGTGTRGFDASCICGVGVRVPNPNVLVGQKFKGPLGSYSARSSYGPFWL
jgi:hypothetical protein